MQNVSTAAAVPFVWTNMPLLPKSFSQLMDEDLAVKLQEQEKKQQKTQQQEETDVLSLLSDEDLAIALGQMSDADLEAYFLLKEQKEKEAAALAAVAATPTPTPTPTSTQTETKQETKQETTTPDADADYLLALKLQQEEENSARPYEKPNTNFNKISVVQSRSVLLESFGEQDPEEEDEDDEEYFVPEKVIPRSSGKAVKKTSTGEYITKHNPVQNAKRNAQQLEKFTGTAHILGNIQGTGKKAANGSEFGDSIVINQTIYNTLRNFARKQDNKSAHYKPQDELFSTQEKVLDNRTRVALLKMLNNGVFGEVNGVISTGKESSVYHAWGLGEEAEDEDEDEEQEEWEDVPDETNNESAQSLTSSVVVNGTVEEQQKQEIKKEVSDTQEKETEETTAPTPEDQTVEKAKTGKSKHPPAPEKPVFDEYAIKIFKTTLNEFKNRSDYMETDLSKQNPRKIIKMWVEKEMKNLKKLQEFNIPSPTPVHYKDHILVMSFLGQDGVPAPKLKEAQLKPKQVQKIYSQIVECMRTMYQKCSLVHADLSEYNILVHDNSAYFIDVCQSVDTTHPNAMEFLQRDCQSITSFFQRKNCPDMMTQEQLLEFITSPELTESSQGEAALVQ